MSSRDLPSDDSRDLTSAESSSSTAPLRRPPASSDPSSRRSSGEGGEEGSASPGKDTKDGGVTTRTHANPDRDSTLDDQIGPVDGPMDRSSSSQFTDDQEGSPRLRNFGQINVSQYTPSRQTPRQAPPPTESRGPSLHDSSITLRQNDVYHEFPGRQPFHKAIMPVIACGAGLFSDGYINNVIGSVTTVLTYQYHDTFTNSTAQKYVSDIAFAGTVVGMLLFGYLSDHWSRTNSLLISTIILIIFTALAAGSYWHGSAVGLFNILTAWRFFVGIGIGGEYPAGSVGCAESSGELKSGTRNLWFILFTNTMIDWGFVFGAFVPYVVAAACHDGHYSTIWRTSLGIGTVFPLALLAMRLRLREPEAFQQNSLKKTKMPYLLALRFYGYRLFIVSLIWFVYDFSTYSFGIYSSTILANIYGGGEAAPLTTVFGWNTVINLFYIPGTMIGSLVSDRLGPRLTLVLGVTTQAIVGFIMAGLYGRLSQPSMVGAFAAVFGIFLSLGEFGPGNNIGLLAAKTCATGVRGQYYGLTAAVGKIGAFVGTWVFPYIQKAGGNGTQSAQYPFYVSASMCVLSGLLAFFCLPNVGQDTIALEDRRFREYLQAHNWDVDATVSERRDD